MNKEKMIVMDLDGTLLPRNQLILDKTKKVLQYLQGQGVPLVLSSGRDIDSIEKIASQISMSDYKQNSYICLNGLEIYDSKHNLLHSQNKLQYRDALNLNKLAKKYDIDMILFFKDCLYLLEYGKTDIINSHFMNSSKNSVNDINEIPRDYFDCLKKVAFIQTKEVIDKNLTSIQNEATNKYDICKVEDEWIEINPININKGSALKALCDIKNYPIKNTIVFGNGENDIEMLKVAGRSVAMGNSFDTVKAITDDICGDCEDDGIANYLLDLFDLDTDKI